MTRGSNQITRHGTVVYLQRVHVVIFRLFNVRQRPGKRGRLMDFAVRRLHKVGPLVNEAVH